MCFYDVCQFCLAYRVLNFSFFFQKFLNKRLKISDMRFATRRLLFTTFIHKLIIIAFSPIIALKEPFSRIVVKSELVLSLLFRNFWKKKLKFKTR